MTAKSRIYVNIEAPYDFNRTRPFGNLIRASRSWGSVATPWDQKGPAVDENDDPLDDFGVLTFANLPHAGGDYTYQFNGTATIVPGPFVLVSQHYDRASNTTAGVLRFPESVAPMNAYLSFTGTSRGNGDARKGLANLAVFWPGLTSADTFTPLFAQGMAPFGGARFMDATLTNLTKVAKWEERSKPTHRQWSKRTGWPIETMLAFGKQTGKTVWLQIPAHADDDYLAQMAALLREQTASDQRVRIGYANEAWDPTTDAHDFNVAQASQQAKSDPVLKAAAQTDGGDPAEQWGWCRAAEVLVRTKRLLGETDPRFVMVYETQLGYAPHGRQLDVAFAYVREKYGTPSHFIPRIALGAYYSPGEAMDADGLTPAGVAASVLAAAKANAGGGWIADWRAVGAKWGVVVDLYEYGQDLGQFDKSVDAKIAAQSLADTAAGVKVFTDGWFGTNADTVGCFYTLAGLYSRYSYFPATDAIADLGQPKLAILAKMAATYAEATPLPVAIAPPGGDTVGTPTWSDVKTGGPRPPRPVSLAAIALADIGPAPRIIIPATSPWLRMRILDDSGRVAGGYEKLDRFPPFCPGADDEGMKLPDGSYTIEATPTGTDGKPSGLPRNFPLTIKSGAGAPPPPPAKTPPATTPPAPSPHEAPAPSPAGRLTGKMKLGLHDGASVMARNPDALAPLKLYSTAQWWEPHFDHYTRDAGVPNGMLCEAKGIRVLWRVAGEPITPDAAKNAPAWFAAAAKDMRQLYDHGPTAAVTRNLPVRFEVLNEVDLKIYVTDANRKPVLNPDGTRKTTKPYWTGTIDEYVDLMERVYPAVKPQYGDGVLLYAAGFSWNIGELERVAPRLAKCCDGFCFHGYPSELDPVHLDPYNRMAALGQKFDKPTIASELSPGFGDAVRKMTKTVEGDWAPGWQKLLLAVEAFGMTEAIMFNAHDFNSPNSAGSLYAQDNQLTTCGRAVARVVHQ